MIIQKIPFSDRISSVQSDLLLRLRPQPVREGTFIEPIYQDGKNPFADVFEQMSDQPYVIKLAHAIVKSWLITPPVIYPREAIVGITRPCYPALEHFSWGIQMHDHILELECYSDDEKIRMEKLRDDMTPLDWDHIHKQGHKLLGEDIYNAIGREGIFHAGGYQGHTIPSYEMLLTLGLDGMLEKIDRYTKINAKTQEIADFYEANRIIARGMISHLEMYAAHAKKLAADEGDEKQKQYYLEISQNCAYVAHKPPKTLYQAVQLTWILSLWDYVDCLGRVDMFLYPFYKYSKEHGDTISVYDSIASLMLKIWECGAHNTTIGGCDIDGNDSTNELSYMFLHALWNIHDTHPRMVLRINPSTPNSLIDLAICLWADGMCDPTIVSDKTVIPGLEALGVSTPDARNYATLGCQEIEVPGKSNTGCEDGVINLPKIFEIAMLGGKATVDKERQIGPKTKPFCECESFSELYDGFITQLRYFTKIHCYLCAIGQEIRGANHAKLLKGLFTEGCIERGIPHDSGGPIYGYGVIETAGLAPTSDALVAIKKLVFEEKRISKSQLISALESNFEGHERIRQLLLNAAPKFGNDNDEADDMAKEVLEIYWDEIAKYQSGRGGNYTGACSLLTTGIHFGSLIGAFPDGRFAGEPLGNTMGPRPGADKSGLSAMLSSVAKLPLHKGVGGTTLNVILTTKMLSTPTLRNNVRSTVKAFMLNGGCMAQITTANKEDLLDAKIHPERHGDLTVRVGGYSIQFVQLDERTQDEIISRYV